jgi:phosphoglucosamine mutase
VNKYFGTDGIRGTVGEPPITPDFMLKLGWAAGRVFSRKGRGKVLIGKDTRVSGYMFEAALEAGLAAAGMDINMLGPMPTPAVAYLTCTFAAQAGIVISASHNPHQDNGIKFFSEQGTKLDDAIEAEIEAMLEQDFVTVKSSEIGKASRITDAPGRYIEFCKSTFSAKGKLDGLKIVVDCANGATYHIAPSVLKELGAKVIAIGNTPDGFNINADCGSTQPARLCEEVLNNEADLGIALDGDGDRVIMVDHKGNVVDGDEILFIIASARHEKLKVPGVVGTLMSNLGLEVALRAKGIELVRAKVGDRYVMTELLARNWLYGGESSGHIICLDETTTGDGMISALQVLATMQNLGKSLEDLKSGMTKFPQRIINVKIGSREKLAGNNVVIQSAIRDAEAALGSRGRVLLRPSGTEPVVRVMVEGEDQGQVEKLARELADVVAREVA